MEIAGASQSAGNGPGAYSEETAQAAAIVVKGSSGVTIEDTYIHDVYGDFVDLDRGPEGAFTSDVSIIGNRFERNGRQAVSLGENVRDVLISGNQVTNVRRSVFDLEPPVEDAIVEDVCILDNYIENLRNYVVAVGPNGVVRDALVRGNDIQSPGGENTGRGMVHVPERGEKSPPLTGLVVCSNTGDFVDDDNFQGAAGPVTTCTSESQQQ
ncbi:MAG: right-handed parallel beta-helix repeat-containing protein [Actinomycetota bacterium]|nr:right-handed parallel beta-helix repeat-containing protein [Actinomycetota bacterium]